MNIIIDNFNNDVKKDIHSLSDDNEADMKVHEKACVTRIDDSHLEEDRMFPLDEALKVINDAVRAVEKIEDLVKNMDAINIDNFTEKVSVYLKTALECLVEASTEFRVFYNTSQDKCSVKDEISEGNDDHNHSDHGNNGDNNPGDHNDHIPNTGDLEDPKDDDTNGDVMTNEDQDEDMTNEDQDEDMTNEKELYFYPDILLKTEIEEYPVSPHKVTERKGRCKSKKYSCDDCTYTSNTKALLNKHKKLKHCTEEIVETELKSDKDMKNEGDSFACTQCQYSSNNQKNFRIHMKNQHSSDKLFCPQCQYFCNNLKELKHHIGVHHEGVRYSCDECNYSAKYINNLREHKNNKHLGITYSCDICGFNVKQKRNLKKHKDKLHPPPTSTDLPQLDAQTDMFYCSECTQVFTTTKGLNRHVKDIHLLKRYVDTTATNPPNKKPKETYSCNICDYSVTNASSWKMHMKKHGPNLIFCDQCDYSTHNKYSFKVHQNQHLGEIFYCDQCSYKSHTRINLRRHVDVKHTKQQHACDQCTFTSYSRHYLGNHIKKQHQEKRYQCDRCNYSAAYPSDLKAHIDAIHNKIRHECNLCDFSAPYKGDLNRHRKTVHPLAVETEPSRE